MMTRMFELQLGKSIEIYVDDMMVKSKVVSKHLGDLGSTFGVLRKHKLCLNASKCSFGVGSGKFLGYMVTHRGIEVNPDQIKAINDLKPPQNAKEVQKLTGMIAALNRFISRSADRCRPFYFLINKWKGFEWSKNCIVAFQQLKEYLSQPPIMSSPEADKVLYAYIAVAPHAMSLVLIWDDNDLQKPVYYVSKSLHEAEIRYLPLEKAILAVVHATRKLPHYFQAHTVVVLTQLPLKSILRTADYTRRIVIWSTILGAFDINLPHVSRSGNTHADSLATRATSSAGGLPRIILVEHLDRANEVAKGMVHVHEVRVGPSWMDPMVRFLKDDILPEEKSEAEKIRRKAPRFWLSEDHKLYKRSYSGPYLLCVHPEASELLLEELHEGIYGSHTGGRSLSHRAITQGYWWPGMQKEALEYIKKCDQCQRFAPNIHQPGGILNPLSSLWSFAQWGLDIVGPFPKAAGNKRYLLVRTDYFTKWVETEPLANIRDVNAKKFIWRNIVTRFEVLRNLISDNGLKFDSKAFRRYYCELGITNRYSTPTYPQGNGQAEAVNKIIVNRLKKRQDDAKRRWVEELPHVLWPYRTTPRRSTGETPFAMTYEAKAVIPLEANFPTLRTNSFTSDSNDELLGRNLDLIDERREKAMIQLVYYHQKLKQGYDANVKLRPLAPGDLVVGATKNPS
uniref:Integrase catalytic domain-containing protein n=1 Tax=Quercus lobata TaxID=97700 RepID=A0A7N2LIP1_QUELO